MSPEQPRLYLHAPMIALILAATAIPVEFRPLRHASLDSSVHITDALLNVIGYIPLGLVLGSLGSGRGLLLAALVSVFAEVAQLWAVSRYPSLVDLACNIAGAGIGALAARLWPPPPLAAGRRIAAAALTGVAGITAVLALPGRSSSPENWDQSAQLLIGDEVTGQRRWYGEILELSIVPGFGPVSDPQPRGVPLLGPEERRRFHDSIVRQGSFEISARIRTDNIVQGEPPARIVTYSMTLQSRNFTLAQEKDRLLFRVRTPASGPNGSNPEVRTAPVLAPGREISVTATYDGHMARVFVNGQLVGRENLRAAGKHLPDLSDVYLPLMTVAAGLLSAIALLGIFRPADRKPARLLAAAGGVLGGTLLLITGGASALPAYEPWMPVLGLAAGTAAAMSIIRDSRCGSSRESSS